MALMFQSTKIAQSSKNRDCSCLTIWGFSEANDTAPIARKQEIHHINVQCWRMILVHSLASPIKGADASCQRFKYSDQNPETSISLICDIPQAENCDTYLHKVQGLISGHKLGQVNMLVSGRMAWPRQSPKSWNIANLKKLRFLTISSKVQVCEQGKTWKVP